MNKGDKVVITDGSYTQSVINGKLKHEFLAYGSEQGKEYVIIETDCKFPRTNEFQSLNYGNDTVIQAIDSSKVVFIHHRFLNPVSPIHKIMIDMEQTNSCLQGDIVEISDKLYKEIRREL